MSINGGDLLEVRVNNPNLGSFTFYVKSGEDSTYDRGGFRVEDEQGGMSGDGQMITKMNRMRWMVEAPIVWNRTTATLQQMTALAQETTDSTFTFYHINGGIDTGVGRVVGDVAGSVQDSTIPIKMAGGGQLEAVN